MSGIAEFTRRDFLEEYVKRTSDDGVFSKIIEECEYGLEPKKKICINLGNKPFIIIKG